MTDSSPSSPHASLVKRFSMSLKIETGVVVDEEKEGPEDSTGSNKVTPTTTQESKNGGFATPKGGPLPTLLFARKHSLNVPRSIVKSALASEAEEKKVESLVTQVKRTNTSSPAPSRPRTPSSRLSQDVSSTLATAGAASPVASSPSESKGVINRILSWGSTKSSSSSKLDDPIVLSAPMAPPSPSAIMSPTAGKAKDTKSRSFQKQGLLGEQKDECIGRKCLVLDLDETLVHSSFRPTKNADFIIPVEIDGITHQVYVGKRPHVDEFLERMGKIYEIVVFTASLSKYANPLLDVLDGPHHVIKYRLYREHCTYHDGCYVKDLSKLGRPLTETLIVDNATYSYMFQPENAIASDTWNDDPHCMELQTMADYLESISNEDDLRRFTDEWNNASAR